ncbi:hypothetical protein [Lysobacter silvisoli]|uniref:Uncharacterized protein n=1 Tax=Lysobacter silvisoli TaxID=2293254 RepID=A0A371JY47_9GAMM|nr:hypothetical protein [Lysobacter silvisoli]RDZ26593.1 hypothetical protein DX914_16545 [Lysobacter silvisoli]
MRTIAVFAAAWLALWVLPARAEVCTNLVTVQMSAIPEMNGQSGGHLAAHVPNVTPPQGWTQQGRTLFWDRQAWEEAYDQLARQQVPLYCADNAPNGSEAARTIYRQYFAHQCTAANGQGVCTRANDVQVNAVQIVMRRINDRWVVYTAYPTPN